MPVFALNTQQPEIADSVFIAVNAIVIGNVKLEQDVNIWYGAVVRGDAGHIHVGARTSVQDNVVLHVNDRADTVIGSDITIGHGAVLEGCQIGNGTLIGMNATILSSAVVGAGCVVAAGTVVREGMVVADGMIVAGVPGKIKGMVSAELAQRIAEAPTHYQHYKELHQLIHPVDNGAVS